MDLSNNFKRNEIQALIEIENLRGGKEARLEREWLAEEKSESLLLPPWHKIISLSKNRTEYLKTATGFSSERRLSLDPRTFSSMAFTAARIIIPRLSLKLEFLGAKGAAQEVLESTESVLEAASRFTLLEGESGPLDSSDLDEPLAALGSKWLHNDFKPYAELEAVQISSFELLRNIQGFLSSLRGPTLRDGDEFGSPIPQYLPTLQEWQSLHMARRARAIEDQAASVQNWAEKIHGFRQWRNGHGSRLEKRNIEQQKAMKRLRILQLCKRNPVVKHRVRIRSIRADGLRTPNFFSTHLQFDLDKVAAADNNQGR